MIEANEKSVGKSNDVVAVIFNDQLPKQRANGNGTMLLTRKF